jgi:hypothetical protein
MGAQRGFPSGPHREESILLRFGLEATTSVALLLLLVGLPGHACSSCLNIAHAGIWQIESFDKFTYRSSTPYDVNKLRTFLPAQGPCVTAPIPTLL